jgi:hypothetical protein
VKSWGDVAKQHGVSWVLLTLLILLNAAFISSIFSEIPTHLSAISAGYKENADELNQAAEKFASSSLGILNAYKQDRLDDRQAMIELIRAGDLNSGEVADAFEDAQAKMADKQKASQ